MSSFESPIMYPAVSPNHTHLDLDLHVAWLV